MNHKNLFRLWKAMEEFRKLQGDMQLQTAMTFLFVALNNNCTTSQLKEALGISQASVSRNVMALSKMHRLGKSGFDLVVANPDPVEPRRVVMSLTPKGRRVADSLSDYFGDF